MSAERRRSNWLLALSVAVGLGLIVTFVLTRSVRQGDTRRASSSASDPPSAGTSRTAASSDLAQMRRSLDAGLRRLTEAFCGEATGAVPCDPSALARACGDPAAVGALESAFQAFGPRIEEFVRGLPYSTRAPTAELKKVFATALRRLAFDESAPASTFIAVGVVLVARDLAPEGLMRDIVERPPAACSAAAWQAYNALQVTATEADVPFLLGHLHHGTPGQSRAAFVALVRVPGARTALATFLRQEASSLESGLVRRLPQVLARSGLMRDHELVGELLRDGSAETREAVMKAIGRTEDRGRPDALVSSLEDAVQKTPQGDRQHIAALVALGASGARGESKLLDLSRDPGTDVATRLVSLEALSRDRDPQAPSVALSLLPSCQTIWEAETAIDLAVEDDTQTAELEQAIHRWTWDHPDLADRLWENLRHATQPQVRDLAQ